MEIHSKKVYDGLINEWEASRDDSCPLERDVTDDVASTHPDVQRLVADRVGRLTAIISDVIQQLEDNMDAIPAGATLLWLPSGRDSVQVFVISVSSLPSAAGRGFRGPLTRRSRHWCASDRGAADDGVVTSHRSAASFFCAG